MTKGIIESAQREVEEAKMKKLEFELAKTKLKAKGQYSGSRGRNLRESYTYWDYKPGRFDRL